MSVSLVDQAPQAACSVPAQTSIGTTAARVLAANGRRKGVVIQNTGTTVIKLAFYGVDPTQSVYHVALKGGSAADDGLGASWGDDTYTGEVRAISSGAGGTMVIAEFLTGAPDWQEAVG